MPLAIVSGASKGIGKAITTVFAKGGFDVALNARGKEALQSLVDQLSRTYPNQKFVGIPTDMSDKKAIFEFASKISEELGTPDILINNAGLFQPGEILKEEDGVLERMIETNLYSAYYLTRAFAKPMIEQGSGQIFNICSIAGLKAYPGGASYCISKAAQLAFSRSLREEMKEHGIKVTAILPGATYTASWEGVDLPESRFMPAEDIAKSVWDIYQLSDRTDVEEIILRPQLGDV